MKNKLRRINEGGGAGIKFDTSIVSMSVTIEYDGSDKSKIEYKTVENEFDITAEGYDDGGRMGEVELDVVKKNEIDTECINVFFGELTVGDLFDIDIQKDGNIIDDEIEKLNNIKFMDFIKNNKIKFNLELDIDIDYSTMFFAGWTRGTFEKGDEVFGNSEYDLGDYPMRIDIEFVDEIVVDDYEIELIYKNDSYIYENYRWYKNKGTKDDYKYDLLYNIIPSYRATDEFVDKYIELFETDFDDDDFDDDEAFESKIFTSINEFKSHNINERVTVDNIQNTLNTIQKLGDMNNYTLRQDEINGKTFALVEYEDNGSYDLKTSYYSPKELQIFLFGYLYKMNEKKVNENYNDVKYVFGDDISEDDFDNIMNIDPHYAESLEYFEEYIKGEWNSIVGDEMDIEKAQSLSFDDVLDLYNKEFSYNTLRKTDENVRKIYNRLTNDPNQLELKFEHKFHTSIKDFKNRMINENNTDDLIEKINDVLYRTVPRAVQYDVWKYNIPGEMIGIKIFVDDHDKLNMNDMVSLSLDPETLELQTQVYGGKGGGRITRKIDPNNPDEKYYALKGERVPFRTPKKELKSVLAAIEKFAKNYLIVLKKVKDMGLLTYDEKQYEFLNGSIKQQ